MTGPNITLPLDLLDVNVLGLTLREESIEITLDSTLNYAYCPQALQPFAGGEQLSFRLMRST